MPDHWIKKLWMTALFGVAFSLIACQDPPPRKQPVKETVVSGRIPKHIVSDEVAPDEAVSNQVASEQVVSNKVTSDEVSLAGKGEKHQQVPGDSIEGRTQHAASENSAESLSDKNDKKNGQNKMTGVLQPDKEESVGGAMKTLSSKERSQKLAEQLRFSQVERYDSTGKTDPFAPLISTEKKSDKVKNSGPSEEDLRIRTPLEKLDWSQMRLVAVVQAESDNIAMVEEAGGKGYIVKLGTYMGKNSGRVVSIHKDRIIISEKVKDYKGDTIVRDHEIRLHKSDNED